MAQKITRYLLITLILSLGFGQLLRFELLGLTLYFHDALTLIILGINAKYVTIKQVRSQKGLSYILLGLVMAVLFSSEGRLVPLLYGFRLVSYLLLYLVVRAGKVRVSREVFMIAGLTTLVIGLLQYYFLPDMRLFQHLGWDDHLNRLTLPHFDPTYSGVMLILFLFILEKRQLVMIGITAMAACLTYARSVLISFVATQLILLKNFWFLFLVATFTIYAVYLNPTSFGEGTNLLRTYSIESRIGRDMDLIKTSSWRLIIGEGYGKSVSPTSENGRINHARSANSSYLNILLVSGMLGLYGWGLLLKDLYVKSKYRGAILFVLIASLFNNVLLYPFVLLWILLQELMVPNEP